MTDLAWTDATIPDKRVAQVADLFRDAFSYEPQDVRSAPGRINIIGEHVDYSGGPRVPIALSHRVHVALSPREDRTTRPTSPQTREAIDVLDFDVIGPKGAPDEVANHWTVYLAGVAWALEQAGYGPLPGFGAALWSCVLLGGSLSSSVAFECATAVALSEARSLGPTGMIEVPSDRERKVPVGIVRAMENQVAGANTGGLDQTASLRCREGHAPALDCRDMSTCQVPFDLNVVGLELLVIDTCAEHSLVDGQYGSRRVDCEESARTLGMGQLVEVEDPGEATAALGNERLAAHTRHVVSEIACTRAFIELSDEGPLDGTRLTVAGALLNDPHDSLHDDYKVSCEELDVVVEAARAAGAHGACMTGDGLGGSAVAFIDVYAVEGVARAVAAAYAERGWEPPHFIRSLPGAPAGRLD